MSTHGEIYVCEFCGEEMTWSDVVNGGHIRMVEGDDGEPIQLHCGPVTRIEEDEQ